MRNGYDETYYQVLDIYNEGALTTDEVIAKIEELKQDENYRPWCEQRGYITANNQVRLTAEIIYRYITGNEDFEEAHTGLEDVKIETEIFKYCLAKNPDIDGRLWKPKDELTTC